MLLVWHIYLISRGETSIEGHDNDYFTTKAKERGVVSLAIECIRKSLETEKGLASDIHQSVRSGVASP
jgi:hypothetical protein